MSEIPDDIWESAKQTVASFPHDKIDPMHTKACVVARAILAERKRCAEVALANAHADCDVAEQIAKEIEAGA